MEEELSRAGQRAVQGEVCDIYSRGSLRVFFHLALSKNISEDHAIVISRVKVQYRNESDRQGILNSDPDSGYMVAKPCLSRWEKPSLPLKWKLLPFLGQ